MVRTISADVKRNGFRLSFCSPRFTLAQAIGSILKCHPAGLLANHACYAGHAAPLSGSINRTLPRSRVMTVCFTPYSDRKSEFPAKGHVAALTPKADIKAACCDVHPAYRAASISPGVRLARSLF